MKILLVILLTGGLIVGVSYAGNKKCELAEDQCLIRMPDAMSEHKKAGFMTWCMSGFPKYDYKGKKCDY